MSGIRPTEAHRMVNFQGKEKRMRMFPLAGDTDNDATYHDDYVAEALTDVPAAEPPVASPAQIQSKLSSFSMPASTSSVVSQLVALSAEDLKAFAKSRTTLHYELVIPKSNRPPSEGVECRLGSSIIKTASPGHSEVDLSAKRVTVDRTLRGHAH